MLVETHNMTPESIAKMSVNERLQVYCGLDNCVTFEVLEALQRLPSSQSIIYNFERALQGPILEMMLGGFLIDETERQFAIQKLRKRLARLEYILNSYSDAVWGKPLNPRSNPQLKDFFYGTMHLPEVWISEKGQRKLSFKREALEKLEAYLYAMPIVGCIMEIRETAKQLETLLTEVDYDGRMRSSYNIAGTECISGDSLLWTKSGLRTIQEVYMTSYPCEVWNGKEFVLPERKVMYKQKQGYSIELEGGYTIKCSANHPLMTFTGWKEAKDLMPLELVQINNGLPVLFGQHALPHTITTRIMSEDLCEFIGMWLADGTLNINKEHNRCRLSNSSPIVQQRFTFLAKAVFGEDASVYGEETCFSSKGTCYLLKQLGLPHDEGLGTATRKKIPAPFMRGKPNLLRAILRGLTLDSHITEKGLMFGTQSIVMREQIQQILLILGIQSVKVQTGNSIKLNVPRAYCGRFINIVGFIQPDKLMKLCDLLNERCQWHEPKPFGGKPFLEIKSITEWTGDVYDLTMPEGKPPQYIANGFTVHNTGRLSSSSNAFGTGGNLQNITDELRIIYIADLGMKMCVIDLEQAEAREVGWICGVLFGDWRYLDACESGDLHTMNARLIWPQMPWTGDLKADRKLAEAPFYRDIFSFRDMSKRGGHGTSYYGQAFTIARFLKVPVKLIVDFQAAFLAAYPSFPMWWQWTAQQIQTKQTLTTFFGRERQFFGRPGDDATLREAIAFQGQSPTADRTNYGMLQHWQHFKQGTQLLAQTHDSITFQYKEHLENEIIPVALKLMEIPLFHKGRKFIVPGEAKVGWNWAKHHDESKPISESNRLNPNGLKKWSLAKPDTRQRLIGLARPL